MLVSEVDRIFCGLFETGPQSVPSAEPAPRALDGPADVLGVAANAPRVVVDAAFRVQAAAAHPDKGGNGEWFKQLTAARDALYKARGWK